MATVESSFKHHFLKLKEIQIRKFSALKDNHHTTKTPKAIPGSEEFVINLSEHVLTESDESVLKRRLNFAITECLIWTRHVQQNLQGPNFPHLGYGVLLVDPMYVGEIKTFYI
jgi:hypothetical protein